MEIKWWFLVVIWPIYRCVRAPARPCSPISFFGSLNFVFSGSRHPSLYLVFAYDVPRVILTVFLSRFPHLSTWFAPVCSSKLLSAVLISCPDVLQGYHRFPPHASFVFVIYKWSPVHGFVCMVIVYSLWFLTSCRRRDTVCHVCYYAPLNHITWIW